MENVKPCPYCHSTNIHVGGVSVQCKNCLMIGPQMNGGRDDDHSDFIDRENAVKAWNKLPRTTKIQKNEQN